MSKAYSGCIKKYVSTVPNPSSNVVASIATKEFTGNASLTALAWVLLFEANSYAFESFELTEYVNWVFLPAALRMVSVMIAGYAGVCGLFLGALITNHPILAVNLSEAIVLSLLSAAGPLAAFTIVVHKFGISRNLDGLKWWHLFVFAVVGSFCNVIPTQGYLYSVGHVQEMYSGMGIMLVGDLVGTSALLFLASLFVKAVDRLKR